ncbi:hypothetical protein HYU21_04045 [Candidatus Woesearchaeota archaeon]|nr:hypothetical protein [Candidatus Woesearchaeota archaeon]
MTLENKLSVAGMIVGGIAGAAIGLDYCLGRFDLTEMDNFLWIARGKATIYVSTISTIVGIAGGRYSGRAIEKVIDHFAK